MTKKNDIDKYIDKFPKGTQDKLIQVREIIKSTVTEAEETISYGMPTFKLNGTYLIYFAGYKNHIGIYPVPNNKEFEEDFSSYKTSGKGTIRFPLDKPIPTDLIKKIVEFRVAENLQKVKTKTK
ncbi:MAG: DUF1801 domain-containing protein [Verrucomicrobia bacterium]|jgi:uncharacterized protein YdhG (YjbR/CyaY superfamily)|nr:DUF1801 domain-containing protein [Verrucomicrobiota bacterium]